MVNTKSANKKINSVGGIKLLMLAGSMAITLGGWGMLAADQLASNTTQTAMAQTTTSSQQQRVTQATASQTSSTVRVLARTRSSR